MSIYLEFLEVHKLSWVEDCVPECFLQNIAISPLSLSDIKNTFTRPAKMEPVKQCSEHRNNFCFSLWIASKISNRKNIASIFLIDLPTSWYLPLPLSLYSSFSFPVISKEAGADRSMMLTRLPRVLGGITLSLVHNVFSACSFLQSLKAQNPE